MEMMSSSLKCEYVTCLNIPEFIYFQMTIYIHTLMIPDVYLFVCLSIFLSIDLPIYLFNSIYLSYLILSYLTLSCLITCYPILS